MKNTSARPHGCHVSISGGLINALNTAVENNLTAIQIHPSAPQRWNLSPFKKGIEKEFLEALPKSNLKYIFFHAIYLINLTHPDERMIKFSKLSLQYDLEFNELLQGSGVIVHVGSLKHVEDPKDGLKKATDSINEILSEAKGTKPLLLEVAAGSGFTVGQKIEELLTIIEGVENKERVGIALDTQHLWASGYNLPDDLDQVLLPIQKEIGIDKIKIIHLNDSKTDFASRVDRHENLGKGKIGIEKLKATINHPLLIDVPIVLETPALKDKETLPGEIDVLRSIL